MKFNGSYAEYIYIYISKYKAIYVFRLKCSKSFFNLDRLRFNGSDIMTWLSLI